MKKVLYIFIALFLTCNNTAAKRYVAKEYHPLSQKECWNQRTKLGLRFCPYDNDHLAGAALACGGLKNLPTGKELLQLAIQIYHTQPTRTTIYAKRDDALMKKLGIWANDSHIFFWTDEEAKDGQGTYVRMFAAEGSIPYYAPRDGSGYVSHALGHINFGETRYISARHDSNKAGLPNNDVVMTICRE